MIVIVPSLAKGLRERGGINPNISGSITKWVSKIALKLTELELRYPLVIRGLLMAAMSCLNLKIISSMI
jgi:hypothetical protein